VTVNRVIIGGRLTRDPETKQAASGMTLCRAGLAFNEKKKDGQEEVSYFDLRLFDRQAESFAKWMKKGKPVLVEGRLKQDRWQDQNGQNRSGVTVIVDRWHFQGGRDDGDQGAVTGSAPAAAPAPAPAAPSTSSERDAALRDAMAQEKREQPPPRQPDVFDSTEIPF
jgi:single-strand DNA-binding protein